MIRKTLTLVVTTALLFSNTLLAQEIPASHGIAMHGDLKYPATFSHFEYVNPDAPKGGTLRQAVVGTFDSFNPFIIKGSSADGIGLTFDTLMTRSLDEPFHSVWAYRTIRSYARVTTLGRV